MRNLHNIEPALKSKPYAYRGYAADSTVFHIRRDGRNAWHASTENSVSHLYAATLTELSRRLAKWGAK